MPARKNATNRCQKVVITGVHLSFRKNLLQGSGAGGRVATGAGGPSRGKGPPAPRHGSVEAASTASLRLLRYGFRARNVTLMYTDRRCSPGSISVLSANASAADTLATAWAGKGEKPASPMWDGPTRTSPAAAASDRALASAS